MPRPASGGDCGGCRRGGVAKKGCCKYIDVPKVPEKYCSKEHPKCAKTYPNFWIRGKQPHDGQEFDASSPGAHPSGDNQMAKTDSKGKAPGAYGDKHSSSLHRPSKSVSIKTGTFHMDDTKKGASYVNAMENTDTHIYKQMDAGTYTVQDNGTQSYKSDDKATQDSLIPEGKVISKKENLDEEKVTKVDELTEEEMTEEEIVEEEEEEEEDEVVGDEGEEDVLVARKYTDSLERDTFDPYSAVPGHYFPKSKCNCKHASGTPRPGYLQNSMPNPVSQQPRAYNYSNYRNEISNRSGQNMNYYDSPNDIYAYNSYTSKNYLKDEPTKLLCHCSTRNDDEKRQHDPQVTSTMASPSSYAAPYNPKGTFVYYQSTETADVKKNVIDLFRPIPEKSDTSSTGNKTSPSSVNQMQSDVRLQNESYVHMQATKYGAANIAALQKMSPRKSGDSQKSKTETEKSLSISSVCKIDEQTYKMIKTQPQSATGYTSASSNLTDRVQPSLLARNNAIDDTASLVPTSISECQRNIEFVIGKLKKLEKTLNERKVIFSELTARAEDLSRCDCQSEQPSQDGQVPMDNKPPTSDTNDSLATHLAEQQPYFSCKQSRKIPLTKLCAKFADKNPSKNFIETHYNAQETTSSTSLLHEYQGFQERRIFKKRSKRSHERGVSDRCRTMETFFGRANKLESINETKVSKTPKTKVVSSGEGARKQKAKLQISAFNKKAQRKLANQKRSTCKDISSPSAFQRFGSFIWKMVHFVIFPWKFLFKYLLFL